MIRHTVFDSHHGQTDERLYVMDEGKLLAYLDYSVYQGEPSIKMIKSMDQRKGYARALVLALQAEYPETEIDWGMLTDDGAASGALPRPSGTQAGAVNRPLSFSVRGRRWIRPLMGRAQ